MTPEEMDKFFRHLQSWMADRTVNEKVFLWLARIQAMEGRWEALYAPSALLRNILCERLDLTKLDTTLLSAFIEAMMWDSAKGHDRPSD